MISYCVNTNHCYSSFLTGKPLEESLVEMKDDPAIDWRSPQRGSTAYYRCVLDSYYYIMRRKGLSQTKAKQAGFIIRAQMVALIDNDLRFMPSLRYRHLVLFVLLKLRMLMSFFFTVVPTFV